MSVNQTHSMLAQARRRGRATPARMAFGFRLLLLPPLLLTACTTTTPSRTETAEPAPERPPAAKAEPEKAAPTPAAPTPAAVPKAKKPKKPKTHEPKVAALKEPQPELTAAPPTPAPEPQPELSSIVLPVKISLAALSEQLDALVPREERRDWTQVTDEGDSPRAEVKAQIWRDPLQVTFSDQTFHVTVPLRYAANLRAWVKNPLRSDSWIAIAKDESWGTKGEPQQLTASFDATLGVDEQWHVTSELKVSELKHGPAPTGKICKKMLINVCVERETLAPRVNRGIDDYLRPRLQKALAKLRGKLDRAFDLKHRAAEAWSALQRPRAVKLPGTKHAAWLVVQPSAVGLGRPVLDGGDVSISLAITGRVAVVGGDEPAPGKAALPALSQAIEPAGVRVIAELRLPYASLAESLRRELEGVKLGKGKQLSVASVKLVANAEAAKPRRITLELGLSGAVQGTLRVSGELRYDAASQRLAIEKPTITAEPDSELSRTLDARELEAIGKRVASKARWNLASEAKPLQKALAAALGDRARGDVQLAGELDRLEVRDFALSEDGLVVDVVVGGELRASYVGR